MCCSHSPSRLRWFTFYTRNCEKFNSEQNCNKEAKEFTVSDGRCPLPEALNDHLDLFLLIAILVSPRVVLAVLSIGVDHSTPTMKKVLTRTMQMTSPRSL